MSKKRKSPGSGVVVLLLGMSAMALVALGAYVKLTPADKVPPSLHRQESSRQQPSAHRGVDRSSTDGQETPPDGKVLVAVVSGTDVHLRTVNAKGDPKLYTAERALTAMKVDNARIKSVQVAGGLARVDIEGDIPLSIGSDQEGTLLKAMQMSLGQFSDVDQIQFVSDGAPVESLGGHIETADPIPVIRPGQSGDATPSSSSNQP